MLIITVNELFVAWQGIPNIDEVFFEKCGHN